MNYSPSFSLPKSHQKLTNIIMDGRKQKLNATIKQKQNKNKTQTKPPTPMGRPNGRSSHLAHCHIGRVTILSKII